MATATAKTAKSFKVTCPFCGDPEGTVSIDLGNLSAVTCSSCDEEFTAQAAAQKAAEQARRWAAVARWVALAGEALAEDGPEDLGL